MSAATIGAYVMAALALVNQARQWSKDRQADADKHKVQEQDFSAVVNQRLSSLLEGYSAVFDEYESRARELLARIAILTKERNDLAKRVEAQENQIRDLKRAADEDRQTIDRLEARIAELERINGQR